MNARLAVLLTLVASAALMRLLPHPPNFTPVAALALFAGAHFERRSLALLVPLVAMFLSDIALELTTGWGFHSQAPAVYLAFIAVVGIGLWLQTRLRPALVLGGALAASTVFFVISNLGLWLTDTLYPATLEGLVACFVMAIPFFGWTVAGDLFYTAVMFGLFAAAERRLRQPALQAA